MNILKTHLSSAVEKGIITDDQANRLWEHLEFRRADQPHFQALHVLYYFGGVLILASMSWFLTTAWSDGVAVMMISGLFGLGYLYIGNAFWNKKNLKIPGGLLITAAVGLTPVFIYGFQKATGLWPHEAPNDYKDYHIWVKGSWIFMEAGTVIVASMALWFYRFTFITFPLALSLWYMSMDLTPLVFGKDDFTFDERKIVSSVFGLIVLLISFFVDRKFKEDDFAYWTYLYGMMAFWGGITMMDSRSELGKFIYCLMNIGFIITSVYLRRRVFIVFGTFGVLAYTGHLAWDVFKNSYLFPIILALLGVGIVFLGVLYQKNRKKFEAYVESKLPTFLLKWRPVERS